MDGGRGGGGGGQDTVNREQRKDHKSKSIFTTIFGQWCVVDKPEDPRPLNRTPWDPYRARAITRRWLAVQVPKRFPVCKRAAAGFPWFWMVEGVSSAALSPNVRPLPHGKP